MKKYKIVYIKDGGLISIEIEASGVIFNVIHNERCIVFLDEHGEDGYVFPQEDVIAYHPLEGGLL